MVVPVSLWCEMKTLQVHLHKLFSWLSFILNEIVKHRTINKQTNIHDTGDTWSWYSCEFLTRMRISIYCSTVSRVNLWWYVSYWWEILQWYDEHRFFWIFLQRFFKECVPNYGNMFTAFVYIISFDVLTCYLLLPLF